MPRQPSDATLLRQARADLKQTDRYLAESAQKIEIVKTGLARLHQTISVTRGTLDVAHPFCSVMAFWESELLELIRDAS